MEATQQPTRGPGGSPWHAGAEPIPGYRLLSPLGRGGFGEVWKCEAPGGLVKAIKFVRAGAGLARQEQELLQRVKAIRHPFILSLERVETVAGFLLVVMELADKSLYDLFQECRRVGLCGVPRKELLALLLEAGEALDWMTFAHGVQHLDVKPHNLFVVSNHLKVADFGLAGNLAEAGGGQGTPAGATPVYAAPEVLCGRVSRQSDQYSLAVVFQQLLTGSLPFYSSDPQALVQMHLAGSPDLTPLPRTDRPVVARALAKEPGQRFPSCLAFVQALVCHGQPQGDGSAERLSQPLQRLLALRQPARQADGRAAPLAAATVPTPQFAAPLVTAPASLRVGTTVAGYRFVQPLGPVLQEETWLVKDEQERELRALCLSGCDGAALDRLKAAQHPALPPAQVFRGPSGRLVLLTERYERSLAERLEACRAAGMTGVPRAELIGYARTAAAALDAVLRERRAPHLGLGPRSLLLDGGRAWVADHGVAALALQQAGRPPGPLNARYAAPELLDGGRPAATSDQYSLALIYAEALSGSHPRSRIGGSGVFRRPGTGPRPAPGGLKIDLDLVPASDRDALARALSPDPLKRFETCGAFVQALEKAGALAAGSGLLAGLPPVLAFGAAKSNADAARAALPRVAEVVLALADAGTGAGHDRARGRRKGWTTRFPMQHIPAATRLKLEGVCGQWAGRVVGQDGDDYVLHFDLPDARAGAGPRRVLELRLLIRPPDDTPGMLAEARASLRAVPDLGRQSAEALGRLGERLLESLRSYLQACPDRRVGDRWPCPLPVHVYPVLPGLKLDRALPGVSKNISHTGVSFLVAQAPAAPQVYVHWHKSAWAARYALLAQVLRVEQVGADGFEVGAAFPEAEAPPPPRGEPDVLPW